MVIVPWVSRKNKNKKSEFQKTEKYGNMEFSNMHAYSASFSSAQCTCNVAPDKQESIFFGYRGSKYCQKC